MKLNENMDVQTDSLLSHKKCSPAHCLYYSSHLSILHLYVCVSICWLWFPTPGVFSLISPSFCSVGAENSSTKMGTLSKDSFLIHSLHLLFSTHTCTHTHYSDFYKSFNDTNQYFCYQKTAPSPLYLCSLSFSILFFLPPQGDTYSFIPSTLFPHRTGNGD